MSTFADKLFSNFNADKARRELDLAREQVKTLEDTLAAYQRWAEQRERDAKPTTTDTPPAKSNGRRVRAGRAVIRKLVAEHPADTEWTTPKVREALGLNRDADHGIQVALSRMKRDEELERPRVGVYTLPRAVQSQGEGREG